MKIGEAELELLKRCEHLCHVQGQDLRMARRLNRYGMLHLGATNSIGREPQRMMASCTEKGLSIVGLDLLRRQRRPKTEKAVLAEIRKALKEYETKARAHVGEEHDARAEFMDKVKILLEV